MTSHGVEIQSLSSGADAAGVAAYSPDGRYVVYAELVGGRSQLFTMNADGSNKHRLIHSEFADTYPSYSPDGKWIVFARAYLHRSYSLGGSSWNDVDICLTPVDGTSCKRLTRSRFYGISAPYFSPDGRYIVFGGIPRSTGTGTFRAHIVLFDIRAVTANMLTEGQSIEYYPAFSPTGDRIVYVTNRGYDPHKPGGYEIWTMDLGGKNAEQLTYLRKNLQAPYYFPDGKSILFVVDLGDENYELWRMDAEGKNLRRIAGPGVFSGH